MRRGYVHLYTGTGKGKTTAGLGLALRAWGAGLRVCFLQFLKTRSSSECHALSRLPGLVWKNFGRGRYIVRPLTGDRKCVAAGLQALRRIFARAEFDLVVADELITAIGLGLAGEAEVLACLELRPQSLELVLTGQPASAGLKRAADLVTEMREVKHYFQKGVKARRGIEF